MKMKEFDQMFNYSPSIDTDGEFDEEIVDAEFDDNDGTSNLDKVKEEVDIELSFMKPVKEAEEDPMYVGSPDRDDEFDVGVEDELDELDVENDMAEESEFVAELDDDSDVEAIDDVDND